MTGATGLTILHLSHGGRRLLFCNNVKNVIVASRAVFTNRLHLHMCIVAELNLAYRVSLQVNFVFDPTTIKNGWQSHHKQNCEYHPAPCHNLSSVSKFGQHYTDFTYSTNPFNLTRARYGVSVSIGCR